MAKELPYFRFTVQDWQNGKISLESYELQGLFISVCGYYWINDCDITLTMLKKKFSNATAMLQQLIDLTIIKHENRHDKVEIEFLNIQYDLLSEKRKLRQAAGSKGGNATAMLKQKDSYKDKDKDKEKDKYKKGKNFTPPTLQEFQNYFKEEGFKVDVADRAWKGYDEANWHKANGDPVKNWKQTCQNVWFKEENKATSARKSQMVY